MNHTTKPEPCDYCGQIHLGRPQVRETGALEDEGPEPELQVGYERG